MWTNGRRRARWSQRSVSRPVGPIEVIYLTWNRRKFVEFGFQKLLDNTDWSLVSHLHVFDDTSEDGTADYLSETLAAGVPVPATLHPCGFRSPVATMNHYLTLTECEVFAKIDNDIVVPPGWLETMSGVMERNHGIELLGMEPGRMGPPDDDWDGVYRTEHARWIGGVGLMRTSTFTTRRQMEANGRFGFTQFQQEYRPGCAWISPDIKVFSLDQVPLEPWLSYSQDYVNRGWQRHWPSYYPGSSHIWDWAIQ